MNIIFLLRYSQLIQSDILFSISRFIKEINLSSEKYKEIVYQEGGCSLDQYSQEDFNKIKQYGLIYLFKIGKISEEEFVAKMNEKFCTNLTFDTFKTCWNDMCTIRPETLSFLRTIKNLQQKYGFAIHVIGNTNKMHVDYINEQLKQADLATLITSYTFSFEVGIFNPELQKQHINGFNVVDLRNEDNILEVLCHFYNKTEKPDSSKETASPKLRI